MRPKVVLGFEIKTDPSIPIRKQCYKEENILSTSGLGGSNRPKGYIKGKRKAW